MKVLMLGWEFPPYISGGLGTACYGLTRAMSEEGVEIIFVLPRPTPPQDSSHVKLVSSATVGCVSGCDSLEEFENISFRTISSAIQPYQTSASYKNTMQSVNFQDAFSGGGEFYLNSNGPQGGHYEGDLLNEIQRYAQIASIIAQNENFDVVHAHDWMTYPAGLAVARKTKKPLVTHIHSTEFDRSGESVNQAVYDIERRGLHGADQIIAVSNLTRNIVMSRYGVAPNKVRTVYNAIEHKLRYNGAQQKKSDEKIVLFLGRITMQKGPEYFIATAKKVLDHMDNVKFLMAGSGDMYRRVIEMAAEMGIGHKVLFTGFLQGREVDRIYQMADLFVMPSVSEPFGLTPLEALRNNVPVLISKQSGVSEVLRNALKVDFWDINEMANKILAVLRHPPLRDTLQKCGNYEVRKFSWKDAARECINVYKQVLAARTG